MKKIMFFIVLLVFTGVCYAFDNQPAQFPTAQMQSVNNYHVSTSYTPQITPVGSTTVYGNSTPNKISPRRNSPPELSDDPMATPIGDAPIAFILGLGVLYVLVMRKKERVED